MVLSDLRKIKAEAELSHLKSVRKAMRRGDAAAMMALLAGKSESDVEQAMFAAQDVVLNSSEHVKLTESMWAAQDAYAALTLEGV